MQMPKHVVSLNKDNNVRWLCFGSKEPLFNLRSVCVCYLSSRSFQFHVRVTSFAEKNNVKVSQETNIVSYGY